MTLVVQRVLRAAVTADGTPAGHIEKGLFLLIGVQDGDTEADARCLAKKVAALRIFEDENGKMNRSVREVGGSVCVVSNFTLCADASHGNRPAFINAMEPVGANQRYEYFCDCLRDEGVSVETGVFRTEMRIDTVLDGPVTILLEAREGKIL